MHDARRLTRVCCCSDDLFEQLRSALVARLSDKVPGVRAEAVRAAHRLQDPTDGEDEIVTEFVRLLTSDSSKYGSGDAPPERSARVARPR